MRVFLAILAVVVSLAAVAGIAGAVLPQNHVASRMVRIHQPPENVWAAIADFAGQPSWRPDLVRVEQLPDRDAHTVWREFRANGEQLTFETVEIIPPRLLVRRILDRELPLGGTWTIEIAAFGEGSVVSITENGEIHNPFFRFLARFFTGYTGSIDSYLKALGRKFGEEIQLGA